MVLLSSVATSLYNWAPQLIYNNCMSSRVNKVVPMQLHKCPVPSQLTTNFNLIGPYIMYMHSNLIFELTNILFLPPLLLTVHHECCCIGIQPDPLLPHFM